MNRAILINDTTAWYHYGSSCTSLALHAMLRERFAEVASLTASRVASLDALPGTLDAFDADATWAAFREHNADVVAAIEAKDVVYVNGEGTLHGLGVAAVGLLYLCRIASIRLSKPVRVINHSCYPDGSGDGFDASSPAAELYASVYRDLDDVAVREPRSAALLKEMGIEHRQSFDCLPLFVDRFRPRMENREASSAGRVIIAGSVAWGQSDIVSQVAAFARQLAAQGRQPVVLLGAAGFMAADDVAFAATLRAEAGDDIEFRFARSEIEWLDEIAASDCVVSGRFHHTIAAAVLRVPFVVMDSNTPKIPALLNMLGIDAFESVQGDSLSTRLTDACAARLREPDNWRIDEATYERLLALGRANFAA